MAREKLGDIRFFHVTIEDGLSQSTVRTIFQDSDGFLWFGTQGGLDRYDGRSFVRYRFDPNDSNSLSDNSIRSLTEGPEGYLWIGTNGGGVCRLDRRTGGIKRFRQETARPDSSLLDDFIWKIKVLENGTILAGTRMGLCYYDDQAGVFLPSTVVVDIPGSEGPPLAILDLAESSTGTIWFGTFQGIYRLDPLDTLATFVPMPTTPDTDNRAVARAIHLDGDTCVWVGTERQGLYRYNVDSRKWDTWRKKDGSIPADAISDILRDKNGRLWIATDDGVAIQDLREKGFRTLQHSAMNPYSLGFNATLCLHESEDGTVWVGTFGNGVSGYNPILHRFGNLHHDPGNPQSLSSDHVMSVVKDLAGGLWIGTDGGGLDYFDPNGKKKNYSVGREGYGPPGNRIWSLEVDREGFIWVGTFGKGLARLDPKTGKSRIWSRSSAPPDKIVNNYINDIFEDSKGRIWVATLGNEICCYLPDKDTFVHYRRSNKDGTASPTARTIIEDSQGIIWYGTDDGLHILDPETGDVVTYRHDPDDPTSLPHSIVLSIYEDKSGRLWVGTRNGGLSLFNREEGAFSRIGIEDGLPDDMIYGILEDDKGSLWMSTNHGLAQYFPELNRVLVFNTMDGLPSDEFNQGAYFRDPSGEMFFGGINGLAFFRPDSLKPLENNRPIKLTRLFVFDQPWTSGRELWATDIVRLPYDQNYITIEYSSLSFAVSQHSFYRYRLEGYEDFWHESHAKQAVSYTNLPPGRFTFVIEPQNADGQNKDFSAQRASFDLVIVPPFWRTPGFYLIVSFLLVASVGLIVGWRLYSIREHNRKLEELVQTRTRELGQRNRDLAGKTHELEENTRRQAALLEERKKLIGELQEALSEVKTLSGLVPICASCKKIRDDSGFWNQVETYIEKHSDAQFTHGICPECKQKALDDLHHKIEIENGKEEAE